MEEDRMKIMQWNLHTSYPRRLSLWCVASFLAMSLWPTEPVRAEVESRTFVYANPVAETDVQGFAETARPFIKRVEAETNGRVTFKVTHGGGLLTHSDMMKGVGSGIADMGSAQLSVDPSEFPLWSLSGIHDPVVGTRLTAYEQTMVTRLMMDAVPELAKELEAANLYMLFAIASPAHNLIMAKPIKGLEDLAGKRIRTYGQYMPLLFEAAGATPVNIPPDELYTALDRGVVDGAYTQASFLRDIGAHEVTKQWMYVGEGTTPPLNVGYHMTINLDLWNSLSNELKVIMLEAAREAERHFARDFIAGDLAKAVEFFREYGLEIAQMSAQDRKIWAQRAPDMFGALAERLNAQGLPGTTLVETYLKFTETPGEEIEKRYNELWDRIIAEYK